MLEVIEKKKVLWIVNVDCGCVRTCVVYYVFLKLVLFCLF